MLYAVFFSSLNFTSRNRFGLMVQRSANEQPLSNKIEAADVLMCLTFENTTLLTTTIMHDIKERSST